MKRCRSVATLVTVLTGLCTAISTGAATVPSPGAVDARVRVVAYDPNDVVKLHGYVGYQIHIEWAPGEQFINLGAGDTAGFDVGTEQNHFFIKPKQEQLHTNLTVLTTRRTYHFDYVVTKSPPPAGKGSDLIYSIRFVYPREEAERAAAERERLAVEARRARTEAERPRNWHYGYCGAETLKPLKAYDDGIQTRLTFPAQSELPAIFVLNDDQSESLLNFHVDNDEVAIHRVARRFILRRGDLVGCVVNQAFAGAALPTAPKGTPPGEAP